MPQNLEELRKYSWVKDLLKGKITKQKLQLFIGDLNEFLKDRSFRKKFGFEQTSFSLDEGAALFNELLSLSHIRKNNLNNISTANIFQLLNKQRNRESKLRILALLYCRKPKIANFLRRIYGYTPKHFVDLFLKGFYTFLNKLPQEYILDISFEVSTFERGIPYLKVSIYIISNKVDIVSQKMYLTLIKDNPSLKNYDNFVKARRKDYPNIAIPITAAGSFEFLLFQEQSGKYIFDILFSRGTGLKLKDKISSVLYDVSMILPIPLRWRDGCRIGITDLIRSGQEKLTHSIATDQNHIGVVMTTSPSIRGETMLHRQGYTQEKNIFSRLKYSSYRVAFESSYLYKLGKYNDCRFKLIHLP